jgi:hypothetical protein
LKFLYGVEIVDTVEGRFCKKVLRIPRSAANRAAESELGREGRRGKILTYVAKYWVRVKQSE